MSRAKKPRGSTPFDREIAELPLELRWREGMGRLPDRLVPDVLRRGDLLARTAGPAARERPRFLRRRRGVERHHRLELRRLAGHTCHTGRMK